ncbi:hypothetical protein MMC12_007564 [Toensbergia leucococca]|nr:hypothetical protein [Toensbergia leucococca]
MAVAHQDEPVTDLNLVSAANGYYAVSSISKQRHGFAADDAPANPTASIAAPSTLPAGISNDHLNPTISSIAMASLPSQTTTPQTPPITASSSTASSKSTQATSTPTSSSVPAHHGLTTSQLTAVIVIPIIFMAIISPILILWFLSWKRRRGRRRHSGLRSPHEMKLLGSYRYPSVNPTQLHEERPQTREVVQPEHASGFNFDLSRPSTASSIPSSPPSINSPDFFPNGPRASDPPPPYAARRESLLPPQTYGRVHTRSRSSSSSLRGTNLPLPPETYGGMPSRSPSLSPSEGNGFVSRETSIRARSRSPSLSRNTSLQNSASLRYPFSQLGPRQSDALSDVSTLAYDDARWTSTERDIDELSFVSALEHDDNSEMDPHQVL